MATTTSRFDSGPAEPGGPYPGEPFGARVARTTFGVLGLSAVCAAPLVAIALWLLLTDPVTAGHVADSDALFPVVQALVLAVGKAIVSILTYI